MTKMIGIRSFECNITFKISCIGCVELLLFLSLSYDQRICDGIKSNNGSEGVVCRGRFEVACESQPIFVQFTALDRSSQHADFHEGLFKI